METRYGHDVLSVVTYCSIASKYGLAGTNSLLRHHEHVQAAADGRESNEGVARSGSLKGGGSPLGGAKANPNGDPEC